MAYEEIKQAPSEAHRVLQFLVRNWSGFHRAGVFFVDTPQPSADIINKRVLLSNYYNDVIHAALKGFLRWRYWRWDGVHEAGHLKFTDQGKGMGARDLMLQLTEAEIDGTFNFPVSGLSNKLVADIFGIFEDFKVEELMVKEFRGYKGERRAMNVVPFLSRDKRVKARYSEWNAQSIAMNEVGSAVIAGLRHFEGEPILDELVSRVMAELETGAWMDAIHMSLFTLKVMAELGILSPHMVLRIPVPPETVAVVVERDTEPYPDLSIIPERMPPSEEESYEEGLGEETDSDSPEGERQGKDADEAEGEDTGPEEPSDAEPPEPGDEGEPTEGEVPPQPRSDSPSWEDLSDPGNLSDEELGSAIVEADETSDAESPVSKMIRDSLQTEFEGIEKVDKDKGKEGDDEHREAEELLRRAREEENIDARVQWLEPHVGEIESGKHLAEDVGDVIRSLVSRLQEWRIGWKEYLDHEGEDLDVEGYLTQRLTDSLKDDGRIWFDEAFISPRGKVMILWDVSSSTASEARLYKRSMLAIAEAFNILGVDFEIWTFMASGNIPVMSLVRRSDDQWGDLHRGRIATVKHSGNTPMEEAMRFLEPKMAEFGGDKLVVVTDGKPQNSDATREEVVRLVSMGTEVYFLGVRGKSSRPGAYSGGVTWELFARLLGWNNLQRIRIIESIYDLPENMFQLVASNVPLNV